MNLTNKKLISLWLFFVQGVVLTSFFPTWQGDYTNKENIDFRRPTKLWGSNQMIVPKPTNRWFTTLTLARPDEPKKTFPVNVFPYLVDLTDGGLEICVPNKVVVDDDNNPHSHVLAVFEKNFAFKVKESLSQGRRIISSVVNDPFSVTFQWGNDQKGFVAPLVHGMAYVTLEITNITPTFETTHAILDVNGKGGVGSDSGQKFKITLNNGQTWFIYTTSPIQFVWDEKGLVANKSYTGVLRIAEQIVTRSNSNTEKILDTYKGAYPVKGSVAMSVNGDVANITFSWETKGAGELLMVCLPHHRKILSNPRYVNDIEFDSIRGQLVGIVGNSWKLQEKLPTQSWNALNPIHPDAIPFIKQALAIEDSFEPLAPDSYSFGKELAKLVRLGLIAYQIDQKSSVEKVLKNFKKALRPWIAKTNQDPLFYDPVWGGVCTKNGLQDSGADYGLGWYNDHHFHYGYFIYSAAVFVYLVKGMGLEKIYGDFIEEMKPFITDLIKDIANPQADNAYPDYRDMDWYLGHTLASGLFPFGDGKNQESTSEAVNAWYGIYLYGLAMDDKKLQDIGRILTATEIRGAQTYWHMTPGDSPIYPENFAQYACVGIVWEMKVDYATWFGVNPEFIHMIQFLPFTPITESLIAPSWNKVQYEVVKGALTRKDVMQEWKGYLYMSQAISYPQDAWINIQTLTSYDGGNSMTNTLYWVATRPNLPKKLPVIASNNSIIKNFKNVIAVGPDVQRENLAKSLFTQEFINVNTRGQALELYKTFLKNNKLTFDDKTLSIFNQYYPVTDSKVVVQEIVPVELVQDTLEQRENVLMRSLFTKDFLNNYKDRAAALLAYKKFLQNVDLSFSDSAYDIFKEFYPERGNQGPYDDKSGVLSTRQQANIKELADFDLMSSLFTKEFLNAYRNRADALEAYNQFLKSNELVLDDAAIKIFNSFYPEQAIKNFQAQDVVIPPAKMMANKKDSSQNDHRKTLMKSLFTTGFLAAYKDRSDALKAYSDFLDSVAIPMNDKAMAIFNNYYPE